MALKGLLSDGLQCTLEGAAAIALEQVHVRKVQPNDPCWRDAESAAGVIRRNAGPVMGARELFVVASLRRSAISVGKHSFSFALCPSLGQLLCMY